MESKIFSVDGRDDIVDNIIEHYEKSFTPGTKPEPMTIGEARIEKFSDGEISANFKESIRNRRIYLVCSMNNSDNIIKLLMAVDAAKRASAAEIIVVAPYFGYARQDRKDGVRGSIGGKVMADVLQVVGIDRMIVIDLHADQIQGFFNTPVDHVEGQYIFTKYVKTLLDSGEIKAPVLCSPDAGGVKRVDLFYKKLVKEYADEGITMAMLSKRRDKPNSIASMELIGDVRGRDVIIIDDMIDTAGTLEKASHMLKERGAKTIRAIATHGVLSGKALQNICNSSLDELIISDTLALDPEWATKCKEVSGIDVTILSCTKLLASVIKAINNNFSVDQLKEQ